MTLRNLLGLLGSMLGALLAVVIANALVVSFGDHYLFWSMFVANIALLYKAWNLHIVVSVACASGLIVGLTAYLLDRLARQMSDYRVTNFAALLLMIAFMVSQAQFYWQFGGGLASQLKLLLFGYALVLVTCVLALTGYRLFNRRRWDKMASG